MKKLSEAYTCIMGFQLKDFRGRMINKLLLILFLLLSISPGWSQNIQKESLSNSTQNIIDKISRSQKTDSIIAFGDFCNHCISGTKEYLCIVYKKQGKCYYLKINNDENSLKILDIKARQIETTFFKYYEANDNIIDSLLNAGDKIFERRVQQGDKVLVQHPLSDGKKQFIFIRLGEKEVSSVYCCGISINSEFYYKAFHLWELISLFNNIK
ncbi:hypothetical protein ACTHGU_04770 [Chitinophagaceae bacterium MMS25-I14]